MKSKLTKLPPTPKVIWVLVDRTTGDVGLARLHKIDATIFAFAQESAHRYVLADPKKKPRGKKGKK